MLTAHLKYSGYTCVLSPKSDSTKPNYKNPLKMSTTKTTTATTATKPVITASIRPATSKPKASTSVKMKPKSSKSVKPPKNTRKTLNKKFVEKFVNELTSIKGNVDNMHAVVLRTAGLPSVVAQDLAARLDANPVEMAAKLPALILNDSHRAAVKALYTANSKGQRPISKLVSLANKGNSRAYIAHYVKSFNV